MNDPANRLISPGMNSRHGRQLRWTKLAQINEDHSLIMEYLAEAIRIEKAGLQFTKSLYQMFRMNYKPLLKIRPLNKPFMP